MTTAAAARTAKTTTTVMMMMMMMVLMMMMMMVLMMMMLMMILCCRRIRHCGSWTCHATRLKKTRCECWLLLLVRQTPLYLHPYSVLTKQAPESLARKARYTCTFRKEMTRSFALQDHVVKKSESEITRSNERAE